MYIKKKNYNCIYLYMYILVKKYVLFTTPYVITGFFYVS